MATQYNVLEAKTQLSRLLDQVLSGEEVIIARAGRPVARLVALPQETTPRPLGALVGRGFIADDFDAPLDEDFLLKPHQIGSDR